MRKKPRFGKCGFSWFAHVGLYVMWGAREEVTNKKSTFQKMCFFVVCPYGHILERVIFSWFAQTGLYVTYEKKTTF